MKKNVIVFVLNLIFTISIFGGEQPCNDKGDLQISCDTYRYETAYIWFQCYQVPVFTGCNPDNSSWERWEWENKKPCAGKRAKKSSLSREGDFREELVNRELLNLKESSPNVRTGKTSSISISADDINRLYQKGAVIRKYKSNQSATINVGKSMDENPQVWFFPSSQFDLWQEWECSDMPLFSDLPEATHAFKRQLNDSSYGYQFYRLNPDTLFAAGIYENFNGDIHNRHYNDALMTFPMEFSLDNALLYNKDTTYLNDERSRYRLNVHVGYLNGYGTLVTPWKNYEALKILHESIEEYYENGELIDTSYHYIVGYTWYTKEGFRFNAERIISNWVWPPQGELMFGNLSYETIGYQEVPQTDFRIALTNIATGAYVDFIDQTSGLPDGWNWSFPGAIPANSTLQNPKRVQYPDPGVYEVSLTASNAFGNDIETRSGYITVEEGQAIQITVVPDEYPTDIFWSLETESGIVFRQNTRYLKQDTVYIDTVSLLKGKYCFSIYDEYLDGICCENGQGSYSVTNLSTGETIMTGGNYKEKDSVWLYIGLLADFQTEQALVETGSKIQFQDQSKNGASAWNWTFEGGNPETSNEQNPQVTYSSPGSFDVRLIVSNGATQDTLHRNDYITVENLRLPTADFSIDSLHILQGQKINLSDQSAGFPSSWQWTFEGGEPETSAVKNPQNIQFNSPGNYTISLTVSNSIGSDTKSIIGCVNVIPAQILELTLQTDNNGSDTYWEISDTSIIENVFYNSPVYEDVNGGQIFTYQLPLKENGYRFYIQDYSSDGLCCDDGEGYYSIANLSTGELIDEGDEFEDYEETDFSISFPLKSYFAASKTEIQQNGQIIFKSYATGNPDFYEWTFEGASPSTSDEKNPLVTYSEPGQYSVALKIYNSDKTQSDIKTITNYINVTSSITEINETDKSNPKNFKIEQNYPNPFNTVTMIPFEIPRLSDVTIRIYNIMGQNVYQETRNSLSPGRYSFQWRGKNRNQKNLSTGIYFYQISTQTETSIKKMFYIK